MGPTERAGPLLNGHCPTELNVTAAAPPRILLLTSPNPADILPTMFARTDLDRRQPTQGRGVVSSAKSKAKAVKSKAHHGAR